MRLWPALRPHEAAAVPVCIVASIHTETAAGDLESPSHSTPDTHAAQRLLRPCRRSQVAAERGSAAQAAGEHCIGACMWREGQSSLLVANLRDTKHPATLAFPH